jgi:hypothetical protein
MSGVQEQRDTGELARNFVLHAALLFGAMLLPYAILDGAEVPLTTVAVLFGYVLLAIFLKRREKTGKPGLKFSNGIGFVAILYAASGYMAATGISGAIILGWFGMAYKPIESEALPAVITGDGLLTRLPYTLTMLAGGVALLALCIVLLHWGRGGLGALAVRLRRHGPGLFLSPWISEIAIVMLLFGGSVFMGMAVSLDDLFKVMFPGREASFLDLIEIFPFLPAGMAAVAVMAVALGKIRDYSAFDAVVRALREDDAEPEPRDAWWPVLSTITLTSSAGIIAAAIWALHVAIVAATASMFAHLAGTEVGGTVRYWAIIEHATGRPKDELAAAVNAKGYWSKAEPGEGLPELLPNMNEIIAGFDRQKECRIQVAAAPAEPEDGNIARSASSYGEPLDFPDSEESDDSDWADGAGDAGYSDAPPLRFCVKVTCPIPVNWDTPPAIALYSSHATASQNWIYQSYFDLYAEGVAASPGGFCTATGELAESYQG